MGNTFTKDIDQVSFKMFRTGCGMPLADRIEDSENITLTALRNMGSVYQTFSYSVYPRPL